jgi:hypothetical protein
LTERRGPTVERQSYGTLEQVLDALEQRGRALERSAAAPPVDLRVRRFDPVHQVAARLEIAGPRRLRAGLDVRGDGSAESYTGRLRRRVVEQEPGESPYAALRRVLEGPAGQVRGEAGR